MHARRKRNRKEPAPSGLLAEEPPMTNVNSHTRDFGFQPQRNSMPLMTLIGAVVAVLLTAVAFGSALTSAIAPPDDPAALSLVGP
jgi:hypothetical protein